MKGRYAGDDENLVIGLFENQNPTFRASESREFMRNHAP